MDIRPLGNSAQAGYIPTDKATPATDPTAADGVSVTPTPSGAAPAVAKQQSNQAPTAAQLTQAVKTINDKLAASSAGIEFAIDRDTDTNSGRPIIKIVDQQTQQVLQQIPSKLALEIAESTDSLSTRLTDRTGLLIQQKA